MSLAQAPNFLPRRRLLDGPTPIQRLHGIENALGSSSNRVQIYAKRSPTRSTACGSVGRLCPGGPHAYSHDRAGNHSRWLLPALVNGQSRARSHRMGRVGSRRSRLTKEEAQLHRCRIAHESSKALRQRVECLWVVGIPTGSDQEPANVASLWFAPSFPSTGCV